MKKRKGNINEEGKLRSFIREKINEVFKENYNPIEDLENTEIEGIVYHGSAIDLENVESSLIDKLREDYSDWDASWVTYDEHISEEFSEKKVPRFFTTYPVLASACLFKVLSTSSP